MAKLSNDPQKIDDHNWYYEGRAGIDVVHEVYIEGQRVRVDTVRIPWGKLRASVRRRGPLKSRKRVASKG